MRAPRGSPPGLYCICLVSLVPIPGPSDSFVLGGLRGGYCRKNAEELKNSSRFFKAFFGHGTKLHGGCCQCFTRGDLFLATIHSAVRNNPRRPPRRGIF